MPTTRRTALGALLAMPIGRALAQSAPYPHKPIRLVVPFPPGGGGDTMARLASVPISRELGQPFFVENLAGAGGNIGAANAARAPADGYTLLYGTNGTHGINPTLYSKTGFDPRKDFEPVGRLTRIAGILAVRPGLPVKRVEDLLALARAEPGKLTFGSAGNGTTSHLAGEMLKAQAQIDIVHVPYRGGALAMTDLLGGRIDFMIDVAPNIAPQLSGARIRALAVSTAQRSAAFPDLPTIGESGVPGFDIAAWDALFAPAGTPRPCVDTLNAAVRKALLDRAAEPWPSSPDELKLFVASELTRWGAAVQRFGAVIE
ncbi:MAG: hypothetical protein GAK30_00745 [Paracidovorax wautersii]|uniref:Tripartite-type tricarboxylate transporter, receptor component TctC n=1 Tax=Paracidovorax wautersii TaxID=1177982 RepID=A0A7V8FRF2_9BURK|nr:MAG: hypothetical protein GAK30_00745 [Paracidovorax wautersii]